MSKAIREAEKRARERELQKQKKPYEELRMAAKVKPTPVRYGLLGRELLESKQLLADDLAKKDSELFELSSRALALGLRNVEKQIDKAKLELHSAAIMLGTEIGREKYE